MYLSARFIARRAVSFSSSLQRQIINNQEGSLSREYSVWQKPPKTSTLKMGSSGSKSVKITSKTDEDCSDSEMSNSAKDDYVEGVVCNEADINENEMKAFDLGEDGKVLIVKQNGKLSALGAKCTHYGAPLVSGALGEGRVRCPYHGACYNIMTGDIEDYPGLDSLPCFQVEVRKDGGVKVRAKKEELKTSHRLRPMASVNRTDTTTFVVVGGGAGGACCAETLRQEGFTGRIVLVCKEPHLPYDRIKLSKDLNVDVNSILLRSAEFYKGDLKNKVYRSIPHTLEELKANITREMNSISEAELMRMKENLLKRCQCCVPEEDISNISCDEEHNIDVKTGLAVNSLDYEQQTLKLSNGTELKYDSVFISTGSNPRRPSIPGADLKNVFVLRTAEEAKNISSQITSDTNVVVLGSSFIGMEAAANLVGKAKSVIVVGNSDVPFKAVLGQEIGARLLELFKEKGVDFRMENGIKRFVASDSDADKVGQVELTSGETLSADVVVLGVGATPATEFLKESGVKLHESGAVVVNNYLETNLKGVFAGGDIAFAPVLQTHTSIGHWGLAHYHGRIAALNMLGKKTELKSVPFFWTMLFGKGIRYAGYAPKYTDIVIAGDVKDLKFVAHYIQDGRVAAVATMAWEPIAAKYAEILVSGNQVCASDLQPDPLAWVK